MEANDQSWDVFLEQYGHMVTKYEDAIALAEELLGHPALDDAEVSEYYDEIERIKNGKSISDSLTRNEDQSEDEAEAGIHGV